MDITDPGGIHALIGHGLRLHLLGALSTRQAAQLTRLLSLLVTNSRTLSTAQLQSEAFTQNNQALLGLTDTVIQRLEDRDFNERFKVIADAGSKREAILKAQARFAPQSSHRYPTRLPPGPPPAAMRGYPAAPPPRP